jgi:hypothetical protein
MRKYFNIIIELDTDTPEAVATVANIDIEGERAGDDLLKQYCFDVTPDQFDLNYGFMSTILSDMLRDIANNIDDISQKQYFGISEEDEQ